MRWFLPLSCLLLSACAGSMVPPCDLEGEWPGLSLTSDGAWPDGAVTADEDGEERIDFSAELEVSSSSGSEGQWDITLTDGDGAEVQLQALNEAGTTAPATGDLLDVRYSRWHVGDPWNETDSFVRLTRVGGSMFAWAASGTTTDQLELAEGIWMESGQETCREKQDDRTSWHASMTFGGEYESHVEVDPKTSMRIDDWDITNALNRRTHYSDADLVDTWALEVVGFLFE